MRRKLLMNKNCSQGSAMNHIDNVLEVIAIHEHHALLIQTAIDETLRH